jgi:Cu2+-exporting ATPase
MIERMADIDTIVFDKTGTLTLPDPALLDASTLSDDALRLAGRLALASHHPLARAVRDFATEKFGRLELLDDVTEITGEGVYALVDGGEARLGNPSFCGLKYPVWTNGGSVMAFRHGDCAGLIRIGQSLRPDAKETIMALKQGGYRIVMISGDHREAVSKVARDLGITDWAAGVKPQEKLAMLDRLKSEGRTILMVGDGLNDAPALAAAHVSLSPATGADVTQAAADAVFTGKALAPVYDALALSKKGHRVMMENFGIALVYNLIAVPLAVLGFVTPLIAAAAMSGSSVIVTVNALRAKHIKARP